MHALVVIGHPRPGSFVHALAAAAATALDDAGVDVEVHDLWAEGFDPVLPASLTATTGAPTPDLDPLVRAHQSALTAADHLVVAHPNWWGKPPAVVAGWMDRVIAPGVAYALDEREGLPTSLLRLCTLTVLNTGDTPPERERAVFGDPLDDIWRRCVGAYLGGASVERLLAGPVAGSSPEQRDDWLRTAADLATRAVGD